MKKNSYGICQHCYLQEELLKSKLIKSCLHSSLKLMTLDALMHFSYANIAIENINMNVVLIL